MTQVITRQEVVTFARGILGMQYPERHLEENRFDFLESFTRSFLNHVPFHNMALIALPVSDRMVPSVEDNIRTVLQGQGGLCWTLNSAMFLMLQALGYDVISVLASVAEEGAKDHVVTVARNVKQDGDHFLIDVGFAYPTFKVVSLDFGEESEVYEESFASYKLIKRQDGVFVHHNTSRRRNRDPETTNPDYYFKMESCDLDVQKAWLQDTVYTNMNCSFNKSLRLVRFVCNKCVAIKNDVLLVEDDDNQMHPTQLPSDQHIIAVILEHFPEIPEDFIPNAISNWRAITVGQIP